MTLFQELHSIMSDSVDLNICISKSGEELTVSILPKANSLDDKAKDNLTPLIMTGRPEEIDNEFISIIGNPIKGSVELLTNMKSFEENKKLVAATNKETADRKKRFTDLMNTAKKHDEAKNVQKCLASLEEAKKLFPTDPEMLKLYAKCHNGASTQSLFGALEEPVVEDNESPNPPIAEEMLTEDDDEYIKENDFDEHYNEE